MAVLRAFRGIRPQADKVSAIASKPYDVINRAEALEEAKGNPLSFLHVIKPEIDLPAKVDEHDPKVYTQGSEYLQKMLKEGIFVQDEKPCLYIYAQTMDGRTQYGIVGCASVDDYLNNVIKKHELTRPDKEEDRKNHIRISGMHYEPVFFAYPAVKEINEIVASITKEKPVYEFTASEGFGHQFWCITDDATIERLQTLFAAIPSTYVADGHHRTAAAALVGKERRDANPNATGQEEYNFFLAVHFPAEQLRIIDYNRVVKDLNGLTAEEFIEKLKLGFEVSKVGKEPYQPQCLHDFAMYLGGDWYRLQAKAGTYNDADPIAALDVTVLSEQVLTPILNITDLRNSKRIDFVGGIRGLKELSRRVDSGEMVAAFALYPVSMDQLMTIADTGNIMPPKTTWFEPKLRSGLVIHSLD